MVKHEAPAADLKSRQQTAADNMSDSERVHRQLTSGPTKSELRTVPEVIGTASAFNRQAKEAMKLKHLDHAKDFVLTIGYLTPDLGILYTKKFVEGHEAELQKALASECAIFCGLIFGIREGKGWLLGARPFLNTPLVLSALKGRLESEVIGID
jgi:hypothetical protein